MKCNVKNVHKKIMFYMFDMFDNIFWDDRLTFDLTNSPRKFIKTKKCSLKNEDL